MLIGAISDSLLLLQINDMESEKIFVITRHTDLSANHYLNTPNLALFFLRKPYYEAVHDHAAVWKPPELRTPARTRTHTPSERLLGCVLHVTIAV